MGTFKKYLGKDGSMKIGSTYIEKGTIVGINNTDYVSKNIYKLYETDSNVRKNNITLSFDTSFLTANGERLSNAYNDEFIPLACQVDNIKILYLMNDVISRFTLDTQTLAHLIIHYPIIINEYIKGLGENTLLGGISKLVAKITTGTKDIDIDKKINSATNTLLNEDNKKTVALLYKIIQIPICINFSYYKINNKKNQIIYHLNYTTLVNNINIRSLPNEKYPIMIFPYYNKNVDQIHNSIIPAIVYYENTVNNRSILDGKGTMTVITDTSRTPSDIKDFVPAVIKRYSKSEVHVIDTSKLKINNGFYLPSTNNDDFDNIRNVLWTSKKPNYWINKAVELRERYISPINKDDIINIRSETETPFILNYKDTNGNINNSFVLTELKTGEYYQIKFNSWDNAEKKWRISFSD